MYFRRKGNTVMRSQFTMQCSPCILLLLAADGPPQLLVVHDGRLLDVQGRHQLLPVIVAQAADIKKYFENIWRLLKIFGLHRSSG